MNHWYEESDTEVNHRVALLIGEEPEKWYPYGGVKGKDYCRNPADAWPIICANKIGLMPSPRVAEWSAQMVTAEGEWQAQSQSPLRAAMICFILSQQVDRL